MKKMIWLVIGGLLLAGLAAVAFAQADDAVAKLDSYWVTRTGSIATAKQMLAVAEAAFAEKPSFDLAWRAARIAFWICDRNEDPKIDQEFGKKGWDWGTKAVGLMPNRVEGYYFGCISLGEYAKGSGIMKAITGGLGGKYEELGNKAIALNEGYDFAGPLRAMGAYYQNLPKLLRKLDKAEQLYLRSEKLAPCKTRTRFYLVQVYSEMGKWDQARAKAAAALAEPGCANDDWESNFYKEEIKKLQAKFPAK